MTGGLIVTAAVLLMLVLSVRERVRLRRYREKDWSAIGEGRPSPLSEALANLIGVAGGIYLSLVVMTTFVELEIPHRVQLAGLSLEPLATLSIVLALLQPYAVRFISAWRRI